MNDQTPKLTRIIGTDYGALLGVILPLAGALLWAGNTFFGFPATWRGRAIQQGDPTFIWIGVGMAVVGIVLLAWRLSVFRSLFANGHRVPGRVTSVSFFKDRGRIEYDYEYGGSALHGGHAVHKTKRTTSLEEGQTVTVLVDPGNPKRTILADLYV